MLAIIDLVTGSKTLVLAAKKNAHPTSHGKPRYYVLKVTGNRAESFLAELSFLWTSFGVDRPCTLLRIEAFTVADRRDGKPQDARSFARGHMRTEAPLALVTEPVEVPLNFQFALLFLEQFHLAFDL